MGHEGSELKELWFELEDELVDIYEAARAQEKEWATYLFKDGAYLGNNEATMCRFIDYIADKRASAVGLLREPSGVTSNPFPWFSSWVTDSALDSKTDSVQVAPQESEIDSYIVGQIDSEVGDLGDWNL